jgi:hypothetical protein
VHTRSIGRGSGTLSPKAGWLVLVALVAAAVALRLIDALRVPTPWIMPDEFLYAELGRSAYERQSLDLFGREVPFYSLVHPLLIGAPLSLADPEHGYALAKSLQVFVMMSAAFPVYAWARSLVPAAWALLAGALTLVPPGLAYAGLLVTEATFYPAFVLASWATARAIARPTLGAQGFAVAAIVLAAAIRLQAFVLLPAFATAVVLAALLERRARRVRPLAPAFGCLLVAFGTWLAFQLGRAGTGSSVLGGYAAVAEVTYSAEAAARFVVYHLGGVLLFTAVLPACAVASLALVAFTQRGRDIDLQAYVAVTVAFVGWMVLEVGVFASRHVHHLAERNLFHVAPLLFVGLVVWLARGAPRTVAGTFVIALGAVALLIALPVQRFTELGSLHNELTLVPLYELIVRFPDADLDLLVPSVALALLAFFAFGSRRSLVAISALLVPLGALASVSSSAFVVDQATATERITFDGPARRWVDDTASGPVAYLYDGARFYPGVLQTAFWNRRVVGLYELPWARIPAVPRGVVRRLSLGDESGHLEGIDGFRYVVAPDTLTLVGTELDRRAGLVLTRLAGRPRVIRRLHGFHGDGAIAGKAGLRAYACRGGTLALDLHGGSRAARVVVTRNGARYLRLRVRRGQRRHLEIELAVRRGQRVGVCSVEFDVRDAVRTERVRFRAPRRR